MDKLKPCPFCGGNGKVSYKDYRFGGWNGKSDSRRKYRVQVICNKCRARGKPIITDWIVNFSPYQTTYWDERSRNEEATKAFMPYIELAIAAVDAVPVVRCRECKHREEKTFWCEKVQDFISNPEWFCADGERKGGDE